MACCKRSSVKVDSLAPYEYRLYLVNNISRLTEERRFFDAKKKLGEVRGSKICRVFFWYTELVSSPKLGV